MTKAPLARGFFYLSINLQTGMSVTRHPEADARSAALEGRRPRAAHPSRLASLAPQDDGTSALLRLHTWRRLTSSSDDDASSGGANDGGDASPNTCDANGGGANPNAGDASPNADGPSRDAGRGPSALLPV